MVESVRKREHGTLPRLTAVAQVTGVVLRLVVDPHVVSDVSGGQQLPADVTRYLLLVPDQVGSETVPRGERRRARLLETGARAQKKMRNQKRTWTMKENVKAKF